MQLPLHDRFFYTAAFFLIGIAAASTTEPFIGAAPKIMFIIIAAVLAACMLWLFHKTCLLPFMFALILGSGYYLAYGAYYENNSIIFNKPIAIAGIVTDARHHIDSQELILDNNITIYADRYPAFEYGNRIELKGAVKPPRSPLRAGTVNARYAKITPISRGNGNAIKEKLLMIRRIFEVNLKKALPHEQAAFLSGLTVGTTEEFSADFKRDMMLSGTSHLTALSGSNITIIISYITFLLQYIVPRRKIFWPTILIIILFVIMTGAESSLVRAAIMGIILLAARQYERLQNARNAIIAAAFGMVLYNPHLLAFDMAFQLSFLAIMGITYIQPRLEVKIGRFKKWPVVREGCATLAAQAAVMPLLLIRAGTVALWSIIPNILISLAMPLTMLLGFLTGVLGFIAAPLALIPAFAVTILLQYEMALIHLFAFAR